MSTQFPQDLLSLFGVWSVLAAMISVASWFLGNTSPGARLLQRWHIDRLEFSRRLPWILLVLTLFLGVFVLPSTLAFSGPPERAVKRDFARLDIEMAACIVFVFGFAFAIDCLRAEALRRSALTWVCLVLYVSMMIGGLLRIFVLR
jgi:hypothetical protein